MNNLIYLTALPLGSGSGYVRGSSIGGDVLGCAMTVDGDVLAQHLSSSVGFAQHDMGFTSDWKHNLYKTRYPDGFELVWIDDYTTDLRWQAALALNKAKHPEPPSTEDHP